MFAVPGWKLPQDGPKTQPELSMKTSNASKKRKRKAKRSSIPEVNASNVAEMWRQHVEGLPPTKLLKSQSKGANAEGSKKQNDAANQESGSIKHKLEAVERDRTPSAKSNTSVKKQRIGRESLNSLGDVEGAAKVSKSLQRQVTDLEINTKLTPLQAKMQMKLLGAHFRYLNETLYTCSSSKALKMFDSNPEFFKEYHSGFREQVSSWPENPVAGFVRDLKRRGRPFESKKSKKNQADQSEDKNKDAEESIKSAECLLPRSGKLCKVADLGCGDAELQSQVKQFGSKCNIEVLSYDLHSTNHNVIKADISKLPLEPSSINVAIFCLALMGTNWVDFIEEAWRVLHWKGELWVAEIKSRFGLVKKRRVEHSIGKKRKTNKADKRQNHDEKEENDQDILTEVDGSNDSRMPKTDVSGFVRVLETRGFIIQDEKAVDLSNKMFVKLRFVKSLQPLKGKHARPAKIGVNGAPPSQSAWRKQFTVDEDELDESTVLKPCLYKNR